MFQRRESAQRFAENQVADYGRDDANTSHAWVALYTLNFLNAYLKHDASAKAFLERTPAENGVPKHFMGKTLRPAQKASTSSEGQANSRHPKESEAARLFAGEQRQTTALNAE